MFIPRRMEFHRKRKSKDKNLPQLQQKQRKKNKLLFNLQQIKVAQNNPSLSPSSIEKSKHNILAHCLMNTLVQQQNARAQISICDRFLFHDGTQMCRKCLSNEAILEMYDRYDKQESSV